MGLHKKLTTELETVSDETIAMYQRNLKEWLLTNSISQETLANSLGFSRTTVLNLLNCKVPMTKCQFFAIKYLMGPIDDAYLIKIADILER